MIGALVKGLPLLTLAALVQITIANRIEIVEGQPDLILLVLVAVALLRGPALAAIVGFWAGLVVDVSTFGTLGLSSLLLSLAGYWLGRFGEGTSASSAQLPRVLLATMLAAFGLTVASIVVNFILGTPVSVGEVLVRAFLPALVLDLLIAYPVFLCCRRLFPPSARELVEVKLVAE